MSKVKVNVDGSNMILGISGKAGVGKDTAADYLVDNYGFVKLNRVV